jgi:hypothetical protein
MAGCVIKDFRFELGITLLYEEKDMDSGIASKRAKSKMNGFLTCAGANEFVGSRGSFETRARIIESLAGLKKEAPNETSLSGWRKNVML